MGIKLIRKYESLEKDLALVARKMGSFSDSDALKLTNAAKEDKKLRMKAQSLAASFRAAINGEDPGEMAYDARELKKLADSLPKTESAEGATYDEYIDAVAASLENDFEYSPVTALEFAKDDFKEITKASYSATKSPYDAAKAIDAKYMGGNEGCKSEGHEGWDGWEEVEGLEDAIEGVEKLAYELRHCIRGAKTRCKDWKALGAYIQELGNSLVEAGEDTAYKRDDEDESKKKKKKPSRKFSSTVEEDEDGRKLSH